MIVKYSEGKIKKVIESSKDEDEFYCDDDKVKELLARAKESSEKIEKQSENK